jgi:hypothetical protein
VFGKGEICDEALTGARNNVGVCMKMEGKGLDGNVSANTLEAERSRLITITQGQVSRRSSGNIN